MNSRQNFSGTSDDAISVARAVVEAINGLQTVLTAVAARTAPGSYSGIEVGTGIPFLTFPIPLTADLVEIDFTASPVTPGADLWARFTQGGVVLAGATDYSWSNLRGATLTNNIGQPQFQIATNLVNAASNLRFRLFRPNGSANRKTMSWDGFIMDNPSQLPVTISGGGRFNLNTTIPIDGVQFLYSTGGFNQTQFGTKYTQFST